MHPGPSLHVGHGRGVVCELPCLDRGRAAQGQRGKPGGRSGESETFVVGGCGLQG